ncbi:MAG TPA: DUF2007 domain-containing protein, partial [Candidatus Eisenbacteria bacterium]|nr:DUF2007 domain-containing protein [Candidatus Eisenbacteria bacterium]
MLEHHSPEYRTVAAFGSLADAELARGLLESDGIPAALLDGLDAALLPGAGRSVRVLVPAGDLDRARGLLGPPEAAPADPADDLVPPAPGLDCSWTSRWIA